MNLKKVYLDLRFHAITFPLNCNSNSINSSIATFPHKMSKHSQTSGIIYMTNIHLNPKIIWGFIFEISKNVCEFFSVESVR